MEITNQKEYLKKYLSGKDGKKKKKKRPKIGDRVTIIDDDIDISQLKTAEDAIDLFHTNEDAPQVVGVIDDRPMHLRIKDYSDSNLWKPVGEQTMISISEIDIKKTSFQLKNKGDSVLKFKQLGVPKDRVPALGKKTKASSLQRSNADKNDSPLRTNRELSVCDSSPPRRKANVDDSSPPRRQTKDSSPPRKKQRTPDISPPRRSRKYSDSSPPRKTGSERKHQSGSPIYSRTDSPQGRKGRDLSPRKKQIPEITQKRKLLPGDKRGKYLIPAKRTDKMSKTLDGKTAGLQNAQELIKETQDFRKREADLFKSMDAEISGVNASTVVRDRKTGKIRDFAKEAAERKEKEKREEETKEKYMQWGKGLKQVKSYNEQLAQDVLEMNKPLARYADDEDLERFLKERERDEDPMLKYIRSKKKKKDVEIGKPTKPEYMGEFMPNRYGIVPGHRWDGVDRSNDYEKKWTEVQNAKHALQEDIYKWSTEDM